MAALTVETLPPSMASAISLWVRSAAPRSSAKCASAM